MPKGEGFPSSQDRFGFPSFGRWTGLFDLRAPLDKRVSGFKGRERKAIMAEHILVLKEEN